MRAKVSDYQLRSRAVHLWSKEIMQELKVQKCHSVCTHVDWGGGGRKKRGKLTVCLKDESHRREREMRRRVDGGRRCGSEAIMDTLWFWCAVGDETEEEKGEEGRRSGAGGVSSMNTSQAERSFLRREAWFRKKVCLYSAVPTRPWTAQRRL